MAGGTRYDEYPFWPVDGGMVWQALWIAESVARFANMIRFGVPVSPGWEPQAAKTVLPWVFS